MCSSYSCISIKYQSSITISYQLTRPITSACFSYQYQTLDFRFCISYYTTPWYSSSLIVHISTAQNIPSSVETWDSYGYSYADATVTCPRGRHQQQGHHSFPDPIFLAARTAAGTGTSPSSSIILAAPTATYPAYYYGSPWLPLPSHQSYYWSQHDSYLFVVTAILIAIIATTELHNMILLSHHY